MSKSSSIDIQLNKPLSANEILSSFTKIGWDYINKEGEIFYLPINDEDYDWKTEKMIRSEFLSIVAEKEASKEVIGVMLLYNGSNIGVNLLIFQDNEISLMLNMNRKTLSIDEALAYTDFNWYLDTVIMKLQKIKFPMNGYVFSEYF